MSIPEEKAKLAIEGDWDRGVIFYQPEAEASHSFMRRSATVLSSMSAARQLHQDWALMSLSMLGGSAYRACETRKGDHHISKRIVNFNNKAAHQLQQQAS